VSAVFQLGPASYADALAAAVQRRVVLPAEFYGLLQGQARNAAFTVSRLASLEQIQQVFDSLQADLKRGGNFEDWRRRVLATPGLGNLTPAHLENIYRTNLQVWHSAGRARSILDNRDTHPFLQYSAILDTRVRPSHAKLHGIIKPVDDPFWRTRFPPLGFQCRCQVIALTRRQAERRLREAAERGQPADVVPDGADADPGWDYDRLTGDPLQGVQQAVVRRADSLGELQTRAELLDRQAQAAAYEAAIVREAEWVRDQGVRRGDEIEFGALVDAQGRTIFRKEGGRSEVTFTDTELQQLAGATFVHNHPSGLSLSAPDLALTAKWGAREIVAVANAGGATYRATTLAQWGAIVDAHRAVDAMVYQAMWPAINRGSVTIEQASAWHNHLLNHILAQRRVITYIATGLSPMPAGIQAVLLELMKP
jgi:SPP1 gp7 family putative phage head morphogenesis protein